MTLIPPLHSYHLCLQWMSIA